MKQRDTFDYVTYSQGPTVGEDPDRRKTFVCSEDFSLNISAAEMALKKVTSARGIIYLYIPQSLYTVIRNEGHT